MTDKEYQEKLGMTDEEYAEYLKELEEYDCVDEENILYHSIEMLLEQFDELTEQQQDFFKTLIEVRIKQRNPDYDIYADDTIEETLTLTDLASEMKSMKDMLNQMLKKKEVNTNQSQLSVEQFAKRYNISKSQQQQLRSRMKDPLIGHQKVDSEGNRVEGGKITYITKEVEEWMERNFTPTRVIKNDFETF